MTTDQMTPSDALEIVASNRELYGKAQGAREAAEYLLILSVELFKQGSDDKYAASIRSWKGDAGIDSRKAVFSMERKG